MCASTSSEDLETPEPPTSHYSMQSPATVGCSCSEYQQQRRKRGLGFTIHRLLMPVILVRPIGD